jgi:hypothetical protein
MNCWIKLKRYMSRIFRRKQFSNYLGEQRAIDDITSQFIPDPSPTPIPVTPTPTPSITPTLTPSVTPSLTPSVTPSLTPTISVTPSLTPTKTPTPTPTITPSAEFFIYDAQDCNDPFAAPVVVKSTSFLIIGSSVKVVGDSNTCYEILNTGFPPEDFIVDTTYTDCIDCNITITPTPTPTSTVTPTPTPTSTVTPTPTPSPTFIYYDAQDCNDPFANPVVVRSSSVLLIGSSVKVVGDGGTCYEILNTGFAPEDFIVDTTYTDCIDCNSTLITPTPTNTPTLTPTKTPTPTPTLTQTPTPSPSAFDPDAQAYITEINNEGGSLTLQQETAIDTYFTGLKSNGLFSKFYYLHLFLGGTANSNGLNAVNLGTYDLTWQGTWAHSVSGSSTTQNNSNYAESGFVVSSASPSTTQTDFSFGYMMRDRNNPITSFQYQGIGTSTSNYMVLGLDWIQSTGIDNFWSVNEKESISALGKIGVWNSMSRSGSTAWYSAVKFNGVFSPGLTISSTYSSTFTPSATPYDINLFRINGLNNFTMGGTALLNFAATYLSPSEMDTFASLSNDLQVAFNREIFT